MTPAHIVERNRNNARKSTGPKSDGGKAASRRNSLRHGQTGKGVCLPPDIEAGKLAHLASLTDSLRPDAGAESLLVEQMALAAARIDACARQEAAAAADRRKKALRQLDTDSLAHVISFMALLPNRPDEALPRLLATAEGCDALSDRWDELVMALDDDGVWTTEQLQHAVRLHGVAEGTPLSQAGPEIATLAVSAKALLANRGESARREALRRHAAAERDRLLARADELWESVDMPARAQAVARVLVGTDDASVRLRGFEAAHASSLHRAIRGLIALRKLPARNEPNTQHPSTQHPIPSPSTQPEPAAANEPRAAAPAANEPSADAAAAANEPRAAALRPVPLVVRAENEPSAEPLRPAVPAPLDLGAPRAA